MTGPITSKIRDLLIGRGPATPERVAEAVPELTEVGGAERALLLMRLDPTLERTGNEMWAARGTAITDDGRVRKAVEEFFDGRPGAPLASAVRAVANETSLLEHKVRELLSRAVRRGGHQHFQPAKVARGPMAKRKNTTDPLRDGAREKLSQLGYQQIKDDFALFDPLGDGSMSATAELVALDEGEPVILFASGEPGDASRPPVQDDAKFKAGLGAAAGKPFRFVWVWDGENDFIFDVEKDAQVSALPARDEWKAVARPISDTRTRLVQEVSAEYHRGDFRAIQRKFDQLHEAIYSRGGVKPTNAAIDELGKLLFLKVHLEKAPGYVLTSGAAKGKRFADIYSADHVRQHKKDAVIQLKDAFREINNLPQYKATDITGEVHTIFSYDEPLRLENPEVLALAIEALELRDREGKPIRLSVPDRELLGNGEKAREMRAHLIHEDSAGLGLRRVPSRQVRERRRARDLPDA